MVSESVNAAKGGAVNDGNFGRSCYFGWILMNLSINPMARFKIRMHAPQSDNEGLCGGNLQRMGSENSSSLSEAPRASARGILAKASEYLLVEHWPLWGG